jgi:catechol 2,3-dioxygenase-like lactoylglutathione lyase family enzyme
VVWPGPGADTFVHGVRCKVRAARRAGAGLAVNRDLGKAESCAFDRTRSVTINRAVPNIKSERPTETRDFFVDLLGFEVVMDIGWVVTLASPTNPSAQVTIIGNDDPAAPGISVEVADVDAVHAKAVKQGLEIAYPLRDEEWGVRRFMLREPSGVTVNVLSHRSR